MHGLKEQKKKATEAQVKPLLEQFGYLLRRNTFKIYQKINNNGYLEYFKIEGKVIFNQVIYKVDTKSKGYKSYEYHKESEKIIVHFQGNHKFAIIHQTKLKDENNKDFQSSYPDYSKALWCSDITLVGSINDVISTVLGFDNALNVKIEMKFLLIEALLNNGFEVDNVKVYPASW